MNLIKKSRLIVLLTKKRLAKRLAEKFDAETPRPVYARALRIDGYRSSRASQVNGLCPDNRLIKEPIICQALSCQPVYDCIQKDKAII